MLLGLDSDDYSESVGKEGHVKRTVHAFNEYSAQMSTSPEMARKPPSPSPRRKTTSSPSSNRRAPQPTAVGGQSYFSQQQQMTTSQSYMSSQQSSASYVTQTKNDYPSGGQTTYSPPPSINYPTNGGGNSHCLPDNDYPISKSPDIGGGQPNYYTKFSSVNKSSTVQTSQDKQGMLILYNIFIRFLNFVITSQNMNL